MACRLHFGKTEGFEDRGVGVTSQGIYWRLVATQKQGSGGKKHNDTIRQTRKNWFLFFYFFPVGRGFCFLTWLSCIGVFHLGYFEVVIHFCCEHSDWYPDHCLLASVQDNMSTVRNGDDDDTHLAILIRVSFSIPRHDQNRYLPVLRLYLPCSSQLAGSGS